VNESDDLIIRCKQITTEINGHRDAILTLSQERARLIIVLNQRHGMTTRIIAKYLGISSARVAQIMNLVRWKTEVVVLFPECDDKQVGNSHGD